MSLADTRLADKTVGAVFTNVISAARTALSNEANRVSLYYSNPPEGETYKTPDAAKTVTISSTVLFFALLVLFVLTRKG